jgi:DNA invertase Pin-like site-specific DNA recombinase
VTCWIDHSFSTYLRFLKTRGNPKTGCDSPGLLTRRAITPTTRLKQLLTISEECRSLGVDLVSLRQNIDTTLPAGRLTFQILGAVAEFERELLRERVKAGMTQARRAGKRIGRPALRHFGPAELERIRLLRTQGASVRKLATTFGTTQWMIARLVATSQVGDG